MTDAPSPEERLWLVTYDCGHTQEVWTFIGDFDYVEHHKGLREPCRTCHDLVAAVTADIIENPDG